MEDKTFELLTKMYTEFSERFDRVDNRLDKVEKRLGKLDLTIENDIRPDIKATLDGYHDMSERLTRIEDKIGDQSAKIENHDVEITVLKAVK